MSSQESAPLKSASRSLLVAGFVILLGIGAATAFSVGFTGSLQDSLSNPSSAPALRIAALERMRDQLGYDGFLKSYRALMAGDSSAAPQLGHLARNAETALANFRAAGEDARDAAAARAMTPLVDQFDRAAHNAAAGNEAPHLAALERAYAALKVRLTDALEVARFRRVDTLSRTLEVTQTLAIVALTALALTLFGLAWFLRTRLLDPLRSLRYSAERTADGGVFRQVWGIERRDEIGALARVINRLRRQLASGTAETEGSPAAELRAVLDAKPFVPEYAGGIAAAAKDLESRLESILSSVSGVRDRIEGASQDAIQASKAALEAVDIAREGAEQLASRTERMIVTTGSQARATLAGLAASVARLNEAVARLEEPDLSSYRSASEPLREPMRERSIFGRSRDRERAREREQDRERDETPRPAPEKEDDPFGVRGPFARFTSAHQDSDRERDAMLTGLANDLDRLERMAANDGGLNADEAADLTASLIEAIDRLNGVVERVAASPDRNPRTRRF